MSGGIRMLENLGKQIRELREENGITLNDFAKQLNVSAGYLSNLETGKTENVPLTLLERLNDELLLFPNEAHQLEDTLSKRLKRLELQLRQLSERQPEIAEFLLKQMENGISWFKSNA